MTFVSLHIRSSERHTIGSKANARLLDPDAKDRQFPRLSLPCDALPGRSSIQGNEYSLARLTNSRTISRKSGGLSRRAAS